MTAVEIATFDAQNPTRLSQDTTFGIQAEQENVIPNSFQSSAKLAAPVNRSRPRPIHHQMMGQSHRSTFGPGHRDLGNEHARERQSREQPGEVYVNQEKEMERRAIRGGFRSEMFLYLQKARDQSRQGHLNCSRYVRGYLSDKKTWEHFCEIHLNSPFQ